MDEVEEKINMKRDIQCNSNKIDKLEKRFDDRDPAKETYERLNKYEKEEIRMSDKMENLTKAVKDSNEANIEQHKEILKRVGRIEQFIISLLVLFALASVYFIFSKTGLKIP